MKPPVRKPTPAYNRGQRKPSKLPTIAEDIAQGTRQLIQGGKVAVNTVRESARKIKRATGR